MLLGFYSEDKGAHYVTLTSKSKQCLHDTAVRVLASPLPVATLSTVINGIHNLEPDDINSSMCQANMHMIGKTVVFVDSTEAWEDRAYTIVGMQASTSKKLL